MREFLKGLDLDKETIDTIMAEHGKLITESKEKIQTLETKNKELEGNINQLTTDSKSKEEIQKELDTLKSQIADENAKKDKETKDNILLSNINEAIGDKKFINDFTKDAIINEVKKALEDEANTGKSAKDLFETITKDKTNIFDNPNKITDMNPTGDTVNNDGKKEIPIMW